MTDEPLKIVELRPGVPSLYDVVARLRLLADEIEAGEYETVDSLFVLIPRADNYPTVIGYGDVSGKNDPIIQFEMAKTDFVINRKVRT